MTEDQFKNLNRGDVVEHVSDCTTFTVTSNYGGRVTAVATADLTNPGEWVLANKVTSRESYRSDESLAPDSNHRPLKELTEQ